MDETFNSIDKCIMRRKQFIGDKFIAKKNTDRTKCRKIIENLRFEGMYTPANESWTLMYPGNAGGSNWGGIAADPERQIAIANVMDVPWIVRLIKRDDFEEAKYPRKPVRPGACSETC